MPVRETTPPTSVQIEPGEAAKEALMRHAGRKGDSGTEFSDEELHQLVAQAAYRRAEQRGFTPGHELDDWLEAETDIRQALGMSG